MTELPQRTIQTVREKMHVPNIEASSPQPNTPLNPYAPPKLSIDKDEPRGTTKS